LKSLSILILIAAIVQLGCTSAVQTPVKELSSSGAEARGSSLRFTEAFLDWYYAAHPVRATALGIHDHDARLPDLSRRGIRQRTSALEGWLTRLERINAAGLEGDAFYDHRILDHAIRAELLELREIAGWRHNPMLYNRVIADGCALLVDREFAPLEARLSDLLSRLEQLPALLAAARDNLVDVPRLWAELAVRDARGVRRFLVENVPAALAEQGLHSLDEETVGRWLRALDQSTEQLERFESWLALELLPRAGGDFRLGRELFEKKLLYEEHFALSVDELWKLNEQAIRDYQEWVEREARRIAPELLPAEVMELVASRHPSPEELISTARRNVSEAREFVVEHEIVTLPSDSVPAIRPTPPYARSGFASMSTPGPFETVATEAYYNITNVDPDWTDEQKAQHLTYFNYAGLLGVSIHEAMPGHFVQLLFRQQVPTEVRKVFIPASLVEGWAHYVEQMMIDEGLGEGDAAIRLGQLRRALQRHARWYAGLAMHAYDEPLERVAERFQEIAFFAPFPALRETQRGTYNPTYLYYALGRMEIFKLREDYRRYQESRGREFSLRDFHDRLLRLGLPLPLAREALMPERGNAQRHSGSGSTPRPSAKRS
jgi:uncharacterized protein (DUF885 family)